MVLPMVLAALVASAGEAQADPCAPVAPAAQPDRAAARVYLGVAEDERAAGRIDSAASAYRSALALDPALTPARAALSDLCTARRRDEAFARGLAAVRAGDCRAALPDLDAARVGGDRAAALLAGMCRYRLGGADEAAQAALQEAADDEGTRASAQLFLGLLALRRGLPGEAAALLESATADPSLAPAARDLARAARQEGRVVLSGLVESGWDSNADLSPGGVSPDGASDALGGVTGVLTVAPWRDRGPYARATATQIEQLRHDELDLLALGAAVGVPLGTPARRLLLEYGYDDRRVGGHPYLSAHRLLVDGRAVPRPDWSAGASYALRGERYRQPDPSADSGLRHGAQLDVTAVLPRGVQVTGGWQGTFHDARTRPRAYLEHGPLLLVSAPLGPRARAAAEVAWARRTYQATDPDLGVRRSGAYLDGAVRLEADLGSRWTAYASLAGRRASSNVADYRNARLLATAGLSFTTSVIP